GQRVIVLLRAVNVGGTAKVPMADLRALLAERGYGDVATYIQSGDIVATVSDARDEGTLAADIEAAIAERMGVRTRAIVRTREEVEAALAACPYRDHAPKLAHIVFFDREPDPDGVAMMQERDFGDDAWEIAGRDMFVRYGENIHTSKLSNAAIERALKVTSTARNLTTVRKLIDMAAGD
ncbi:MAG: DUF1697 domain-containing protein, partial [Thermomicrobiales bacterium]